MSSFDDSIHSDVDAEFDAQRGIVYKEIKRLGVSYIGEVSFNTGISWDTCKFVISRLVKSRHLSELTLSPNTVHPLLARRLAYFWSKGMYGYDQFSRKRWFHVPLREPTAVEALKILDFEKKAGRRVSSVQWTESGEILAAT